MRIAAAVTAGICAFLGATASSAFAEAPAQVTAPSITVAGATLTASSGTWTIGGVAATPTFTYAWQRCTTAAVPVCSSTGGTAATHTLTAADANQTLSVLVTATDPAVLTPTDADRTTSTSPVAGPFAAPGAATAAPTVTLSGNVVTATDGTWPAATPAATLTRQWYRCSTAAFAAATCTAVAGQTGATYTLSSADANLRPAVQVTNTNAVGATSATAVLATAAAAPTATTQPILAGAATLGTPLVVSPGAFTGTPAPAATTFRWQRCDAAGANCGDIVGASTGTTYTLDIADVGFTVQAVVTSTNVVGVINIPLRTAVVTAGGTSFTPPVSVDTQATQPGDTFNVTAPVGTTPKATSPTPAGILQFTPFPVVRVKGVLTASGARVTLLSVTAPKGVGVKISCSGRGCPRTQTVNTTTKSVTRVTRFQRSLRAGVKITIKVFRTGYRGKYTTITIRKGTSPARRDGCLTATGRPMACQGG